jgi:hypothetical protein
MAKLLKRPNCVSENRSDGPAARRFTGRAQVRRFLIDKKRSKTPSPSGTKALALLVEPALPAPDALLFFYRLEPEAEADAGPSSHTCPDRASHLGLRQMQVVLS